MRRPFLSTQAHRNQGFTIVEALIVLAIAGLILLITFEAIPTLTRSSRNNSRKQDATAILQAVSEYELNNSGDFPNACGGAQPACKTGSKTSLLYYAKMTYYNPTNTSDVIVVPQSESSAQALGPIGAKSNLNAVDVYDYEKCVNGVQNSATPSGADYSNTVAMYAVETSTGTLGMCQQL